MFHPEIGFGAGVNPDAGVFAPRRQAYIDVVRVGSGGDHDVRRRGDSRLIKHTFVERRSDDVERFGADQVGLLFRILLNNHRTLPIALELFRYEAAEASDAAEANVILELMD